MQWRRSISFVALLVFVSITPLHAQAPQRESRTWSDTSLPVEALHLVQKRDNLHLLAAYYYGDARQWFQIFQTNRQLIKHRNLIEPGQTLRLILSPGWTPLEPYDQWKARVEKMIPSVMAPTLPAPAHQAPAPTPISTTPERRFEGAVQQPTAWGGEGGESPQDAFRRAKAAADRDDLRGFLRVVSPDARAIMSYTMVTGANIGISMQAAAQGEDGSRAQRELDLLLRTHGVKEYPKDGPPINQKDPQAVAAVARQMFKDVDTIALILDLEALMAQLGFEGGSSRLTHGIAGEITSVEVYGDRAVATVGGKPGAFVKLDGRWYLDPEIKG